MIAPNSYRNRDDSSNKRLHHGLTLIELLVVISIVALVIVILLPAVQSVRESARRNNCSGHLRQIGLALENYASIHNVFPNSTNGINYSYIAMLLPQLEQPILFNSINFSVNAPNNISGKDSNDTALTTTLQVLLCPSSSNNGLTKEAQTNFVGNIGTNDPRDEHNGFFVERSWSRQKRSPVSESSFIDGLSQTIALSEWVPDTFPLSQPDQLSRTFDLAGLSSKDSYSQFVDECLNGTKARFDYRFKTSVWISGTVGNTMFSTSLPPNRRSCISDGQGDLGILTSGSRHSSGVNALFGDGHVQFVSRNVSIEVWRALGTRNSQEVVTSGDY